jgi:enoyl-CoA hydratase/carnithine racemase
MQLELQKVLRESVGRYAAIILTGAGTSFCAGLDADEVAEKDFSRQGNTWIDTHIDGTDRKGRIRKSGREFYLVCPDTDAARLIFVNPT